MRAPIPLLTLLTFFSLSMAAYTSWADTVLPSQTIVIPELKTNKLEGNTTSDKISTQVQGLPSSSPPIIINVQLPNTANAAAVSAPPPPPPSLSTPPAAPMPTVEASPPGSGVVKLNSLKGDPRSKAKEGEIVVQIPPTPSIKLVIDKRFVNAPEIKKLYAMLGASETNRRIHFVDNRLLGEANPYDNIIYLQPRSFLDVLNYLSDSVDVPKELIKSGLVPAPRYPDGRIFNLKQMTNGILNIYRSKKKPNCNVNVAIYYRNNWFYIKDDDVSSKRTFLLVQQLFNIQSGEMGKTTPILTIPVR